MPFIVELLEWDLKLSFPSFSSNPTFSAHIWWRAQKYLDLSESWCCPLHRHQACSGNCDWWPPCVIPSQVILDNRQSFPHLICLWTVILTTVWDSVSHYLYLPSPESSFHPTSLSALCPQLLWKECCALGKRERFLFHVYPFSIMCSSNLVVVAAPLWLMLWW